MSYHAGIIFRTGPSSRGMSPLEILQPARTQRVSPNMPTPRFRDLLRVTALWLTLATARADDGPYVPKVEPASDEAQSAIAGFRLPDGLKVETFAAEPLLANPVAFAIDGQNRFYVAETFRLHAGVTDIRQHMDWLERDLSSRTPADRVAMYRERLSPEEFARWGTEHDRIRRIEDRNGDHVADVSTVFADGFKGQETGIGAGLVARGDTVWFTDIPNLWKLRDADDDGTADERTFLSTGYGAHVGFLGHDLHGAIIGPDGWLYFSIGDRGLNVKDRDGNPALFIPDTGSILRCDPEDGWPLEVVATGLRNPQELAFNEHGDLFTVDNNSDSGDRARLVHVVEGGDSGWRIGYQFLKEPVSRGPWNAEQLWHPAPDNTAAYLLPPLANLSDGPSGLTYHPGVSLLSPEYENHFFLADFRGSPGQSGVRTFTVTQKGASYSFDGEEQFFWGLEATDVDFGTDGALYVSDWVEGWGLTGKGRIYRVFDPERVDETAARDVQTLLAEGMGDRTGDELATLLGHADMRVRQEAQFELVKRVNRQTAGTSETPPAECLVLQNTARDANASPLARRHAIWGLGQLARDGQDIAVTELVQLLQDQAPDVRSQAARGLSNGAWAETGRQDLVAERSKQLIDLLKDASSRVRFAAALALGQPGQTTAVRPVLEMLRENADRDTYLRHAGVMALVGIGEKSLLVASAADESPSIRLGILLALRRLGAPEVALFLDDKVPELVLEAARAINDVPIEPAFARLASLKVEQEMPEALLRRVVNANLRLGGTDQARALAGIAATGSLPGSVRVMALEALAEWGNPEDLDRIIGVWRPIPERPVGPAVAALSSVLPDLLGDAPEDVRRAASRAASALGVREATPALLALLENTEVRPETRVEALRGLEALNAESLLGASRKSLDDSAGPIRSEALRILARLRPEEAVPGLKQVLGSDDLKARQHALATLGDMKAEEADPILADWLDRLNAGAVPPALQLDLIEAAGQRSDESVRARLEQYKASRPGDDPLAPYRVALEGGDAGRGMSIFREKAEVSCLRCHKIDGKGGEVGPDLTGIGEKKDREYVLRSIVQPNAEIAEGFETLVLALTDGQVVSGIARGEQEGSLRLMTPEGELKLIPEGDIEERARGASAMPEDLIQQLTPRELRDLVEFLSGTAEQHREAF